VLLRGAAEVQEEGRGRGNVQLTGRLAVLASERLGRQLSVVRGFLVSYVSPDANPHTKGDQAQTALSQRTAGSRRVAYLGNQICSLSTQSRARFLHTNRHGDVRTRHACGEERGAMIDDYSFAPHAAEISSSRPFSAGQLPTVDFPAKLACASERSPRSGMFQIPIAPIAFQTLYINKPRFTKKEITPFTKPSDQRSPHNR
jgi:hypothetical protein